MYESDAAEYLPCLLEILYAGYIVDIRKTIGQNKWPFHKVRVTKTMLKEKKKLGAVRQALGRFGFPFDDGKVKLDKTFQSVVTGIVSNEEHDTFLRLLKNAVGLMKRDPPVEEVARAPKKAKSFLTSKGNHFCPSPETIVEFFKNDPDKFASFHTIANITFSNTYKPCETDQPNIDALFAIHKKETKDKEDKKKAKTAAKMASKTASTKKGKRKSAPVEEASSVEEEAEEDPSESGSSGEETEEHSNKRKNPSDDELSADAGDTSEMSKSGGTKKAKKNPLPENPSDDGSE